ncbi:MAG: hypothetical protein WBL06_02220 [Pseudolysinimonas sp.]|jgi:hypothetical protein|uniref:hypothetical protein n=1 Tax=Pseudolysinimonas sp. TaxID=2680009 RepID=UPI003C7171DD
MTDTAQSNVILGSVAISDIDRKMAEVEKGQQLAGHFPDAEALGRARRILTGETTPAEARAELDAKYSRG